MADAFSLDEYRDFLCELNALGYEFRTFSQVEPVEYPAVWVRHDVDYSWTRAQEMFEIDCSLDWVYATYFLRDWAIDAGHWFSWDGCECNGVFRGYHYEYRNRQEIAFDVADRIFSRQRELGFDVVSAHGKPFLPDARGVVLSECNVYRVPRSCGYYLTDTGRFHPRWNVYDRCFYVPLFTEQFDTFWWPEIRQKVREQKPNLVVNFHPDRWTSSRFGRFSDMVQDSLKGWVKEVLLFVRDR